MYGFNILEIISEKFDPWYKEIYSVAVDCPMLKKQLCTSTVAMYKFCADHNVLIQLAERQRECVREREGKTYSGS